MAYHDRAWYIETAPPTLGALYACLAAPLLLLTSPDGDAVEGRIENRIFWILLCFASLALIAKQIPNITIAMPPRAVVWLSAYLFLAGSSIFWALEPDLSFRRFVLQLTIVASVLLPPLFSRNRSGFMTGLFCAFAAATVLNLLFVFITPATPIGHPGMYGQKNQLGEVASLAFLLGLYHAGGPRNLGRVAGIGVAAIAIGLVIASQSKTSAGLALICPVLGALFLVGSILLRTSPVIVMLYLAALSGAAIFIALELFDLDSEDILSFVFGDPTLTGRTVLWNFAAELAARRPFLGWGFGSFWQVGVEAPSFREAPGWIGMMNDAHNGYLDVWLTTGFCGLVLMVGMILASIHDVKRLARTEPRRAWSTISLILFIACHNMLESSWSNGFNPAWLVYLILIASADEAALKSPRELSSARYSSR